MNKDSLDRHITIPFVVWEKIDAHAKRSGISVEQAIGIAIKSWIDSQPVIFLG